MERCLLERRLLLRRILERRLLDLWSDAARDAEQEALGDRMQAVVPDRRPDRFRRDEVVAEHGAVAGDALQDTRRKTRLDEGLGQLEGRQRGHGGGLEYDG